MRATPTLAAVVALAGAVALGAAPPAQAQTDLERFNNQCSACHVATPGAAGDRFAFNGAGSKATIDAAIGAVPTMAGISTTFTQAIANYLQTQVNVNLGTIPRNAARSGIVLGLGSTLHLGRAVTGYNTLQLVAPTPTRGTVALVESPPGSGNWSATYTPNPGAFGPDSFGYQATGTRTSSTRTVSLEIEAPTAPVVESVARTVALDSPGVDIMVSVTGGQNNRITAIVNQSGGIVYTDGKARGVGTLTTPLNVPLAGTAATFRYVPPPGGFGTEVFAYTSVADGGASATGTITLTVNPAPASVSAATLSVPLNTPTALDLRPFIGGSDISGVRIVAAPAHGQAAISGTTLTYTPRRNYFGADTLTWSAFGVLGESVATATVAIQVVGRPDPTQDPVVTGLVAAQAEAAQRLAWTQIDAVQRRLERLHRARGGGALPATPGGARLTAEADASPSPFAPLAADLFAQAAQTAQSGSVDLGAAARAVGVAGDSGFWLAGRVALGRRDGGATQSALRSESDSATLGFDRRFGERLAAGLALGTTRDHSTIGSDGSFNRARGESFALYGSWQAGDALFVDATFGHGRLRMTSERFVDPIDDIARSQRRARVAFGALTVGFEHTRAPFVVAPYARWEAARWRLDEATETGAGAYALRFLAQRGEQQRLALGLRIEAPHETRFGVATPWLRAEALREFKGDGAAQVAYADQPGGPLYSLAPRLFDRHAVQVGAGVEWALPSGLALAFEAQVQAASGTIRSQALRLQLSKTWGPNRGSRLPALADAPEQPLDLQFDLGLAWDDNVTRGKDAQDRLADLLVRASVSHDRVIEISSTTQAILRGLFGVEAARRWPELGRAMLEAGAELRYRASGEFGAPTWGLFARAAYDNYQSALRDGPRYAAGGSVRRAFTDRVSAGATLGYNLRQGRSAVFDLADTSLRLNLDWRSGEAGLFYGSAELRDGDIVSTGRLSLDNLGLAEVFVDDDAFPGRDLHSYRFKARVGVLRLGTNWRIGPDSTIDLSWTHSVARPRADLPPTFATPRYFANQVRFVYLARY